MSQLLEHISNELHKGFLGFGSYVAECPFFWDMTPRHWKLDSDVSIK
jgi:hypothetical protein